ncbi:SEC-C domain-containing protein [Tumidithrix elongata RA019]|uniref:SEC-C domain-containing protein n=1 Tax=Tumidithrix elongata BACA0141 TaxID=2716417 RepID=A0AAW9Q408_9CYAN|nr:SEC-C domain-containing protein [Tumidithrix elongata RA019]
MVGDNKPPRAIYRAEGITESERYLKKLCEHTFLSLWSYSGVYRDQGNGKAGEGKEVCDLLVVFQDHIIIFSDKDCAFPDTGNLDLDWSRWFRRAILESAEQVWGAERWIKSYPDRLFLDRACKQKFPIELPELTTAQFHRIVVAHGSATRSKQVLRGSGSLMIDPHVIGSKHYEPQNSTINPFTIGQINPKKGFVHVLDNTSLDIVLQTLDTITDFVEYLTKKESFILSGKLGWAAGEEDLLACYLTKVNQKDEHDFIVPHNVTQLFIDQGHWEKFTQHSQRLAQLEANKVSYAWDALIEVFSTHIIAGTQYFASHVGVSNGEKSIRFLARESRTRRRLLASALLEIIGKRIPPDARYTRIILPSHEGDPYYVFLLLPHPPNVDYENYREVRRRFLEACCRVLKVKYPDALDIMGIATEVGMKSKRSEDAIYFDARHWTEEDQADALDLQQDLNLFQDLKGYATRIQEYPELPLRGKKTYIQPGKMKGRDRNLPCPCGSGKKYKKCCGR